MHPEPMTPMEWCHFCKSSPSAGERGCPEAHESCSGAGLAEFHGRAQPQPEGASHYKAGGKVHKYPENQTQAGMTARTGR